MADPQKSMKKILTFLGFTLLFSIPLYIVIIRSGSLQTNGGLWILALMWTPGVSGILTYLIHDHTLRGIGWKFGKARYLLIAYLTPLLYCLLVYGITWISGMGGVPNLELLSQLQVELGKTMSPVVLILIFGVSTATMGVLQGMFSAAGEEIGWRGLFVPELAKVTSFNKTVIISGLVWTC